VSGASSGTLLLLSMVGGGGIPLLFMPQWLQKAATFSPVRWIIYALEGGVWRQFSFLEMLTPCLVLLGIGAGCFTLGCVLFARADR
jgi:ABC-2 type transport system permease protein